MNVTLFDDRCSPCVRKELWKQLKAKAAEKRMLLERRDVRKDPIARHEADVVYGMPTPFVVNEKGVAMSVSEFLHG